MKTSVPCIHCGITCVTEEPMTPEDIADGLICGPCSKTCFPCAICHEPTSDKQMKTGDDDVVCMACLPEAKRLMTLLIAQEEKGEMN